MKSSILSGLALGVAPFFVAEQVAFANPLGGVVAAGTATISQSGATLTINQTSSRAVINWGSFNISAGESTSFHFLGAAGANDSKSGRATAVPNPRSTARRLNGVRMAQLPPPRLNRNFDNIITTEYKLK